MADKIQIRRDTAANWTSVDPILSDGEQGYETDTGKIKIGDGATAWTSLAYNFESGGGGGDVSILTAPVSIKTAANVPLNLPLFTDPTTGNWTADATDNLGSLYFPWKALDGDPATFYHSNSASAVASQTAFWFYNTVDSGYLQSVSWMARPQNTNIPSEVDLYGTNDAGATWTFIENASTAQTTPVPSGTPILIEFQSTASYQGCKFVAKAMNGGPDTYWEMFEVNPVITKTGGSVLAKAEVSGSLTNSTLSFSQYESGVLTSYTLSELAGGGAEPVSFDESYEFENNLTNDGTTGASTASSTSVWAYEAGRNGTTTAYATTEVYGASGPKLTITGAGTESSDFFIAVWANKATFGLNGSPGSIFPVIANDTFANGHFALGYQSNSQVLKLYTYHPSVGITTTTLVDVTTLGAVCNAWNHYAIRKVSNIVTVFFNGVQVGDDIDLGATLGQLSNNLTMNSSSPTGTISMISYDQLYIANEGFIPANSTFDPDTFAITTPSYGDADVDTHLNTSTATSGQVLSYTGADYDWIDAGGGFDPATAIKLELGLNSSAGSQSYVIGENANSTDRCVSLGYDTDNLAINSTAIGYNAKTNGQGSVAIGSQSYARDNGVSIGSNSGYLTSGRRNVLIGNTAGFNSGVVNDSIHINAGSQTSTIGSSSELLIQTPTSKIKSTDTAGFTFIDPINGTVALSDLVGGGGATYSIDESGKASSGDWLNVTTASVPLASDRLLFSNRDTIPHTWYGSSGTGGYQFAVDSQNIRLVMDQEDNGNVRLTGYTFVSGNDEGLTLEGKSGSAAKSTIKLVTNGNTNIQITNDKVLMPTLPTADPVTAGQLWNDAGTLKISAG